MIQRGPCVYPSVHPFESFHLFHQDKGTVRKCPAANPALAICWRGSRDRRNREQAVSSLLRQHPGNKCPWHLTPFRACQFPG